jgi:hypothetical protein
MNEPVRDKPSIFLKTIFGDSLRERKNPESESEPHQMED